jgi:hypothetical protein
MTRGATAFAAARRDVAVQDRLDQLLVAALKERDRSLNIVAVRAVAGRGLLEVDVPGEVNAPRGHGPQRSGAYAAAEVPPAGAPAAIGSCRLEDDRQRCHVLHRNRP